MRFFRRKNIAASSIIKEIETRHCLKSIKIKKVFFTLDYYGNVIDTESERVLFEFRMNENGFHFQGIDFSGKWIREPSSDWTDSLPGYLVDSDGNELVKCCVLERYEDRKNDVVIRKLFSICTRSNEYLLWCLAELYPLHENPHKLLVLSDSKKNVLMRGRTESFHKEFHILHNNSDISILLPVYFNYYMIPPIRSG